MSKSKMSIEERIKKLNDTKKARTAKIDAALQTLQTRQQIEALKKSLKKKK